jgi:hypothetical protein
MEVRADAGGIAVTRGGEQGGWAPEPRPAPERTPAEQALWRRAPAPDADVPGLREAVLRELPPDWARRIAVAATRARITEEVEGAGPARRLERDLTSAVISFHEAGGLALWSRATWLARPRDGWPDGWVDAVVRELLGWSAAWKLGEPEALRGLPVVADVFAMADLVRGAARGWLAGSPPPGAAVAPSGVDVVDEGSDGAEGGGEVVRGGRLQVGGEGAPRLRSSWREMPVPGWAQLRLSVGEAAACPWPGSAAVLGRVARVGGVTFGAGQLVEAGRARGRWGPWPIPAPAWWLLRIVQPCGPAVPDGAGPPVVVPPCLIEESPF